MTTKFFNDFQAPPINCSFLQSSKLQQSVLYIHAAGTVVMACILSGWLLSHQKNTFGSDAVLDLMFIAEASIFFFYFSAHLTTWTYFTQAVKLPKVIEAHHFFNKLGMTQDTWLKFISTHELKVFVADQTLFEGTHIHVNAKIYCFFNKFGTHWQFLFNRALKQRKVCFDYTQASNIIEAIEREQLEKNNQRAELKKINQHNADLMEENKNYKQNEKQQEATIGARDDTIENYKQNEKQLEVTIGARDDTISIQNQCITEIKDENINLKDTIEMKDQIISIQKDEILDLDNSIQTNKTSKTKDANKSKQCFIAGMAFSGPVSDMIINPSKYFKMTKEQVKFLFVNQLAKYPALLYLHCKYTSGAQVSYNLYLSQYGKKNMTLENFISEMKDIKLMSNAVITTVMDILGTVGLAAGKGDNCKNGLSPFIGSII